MKTQYSLALKKEIVTAAKIDFFFQKMHDKTYACMPGQAVSLYATNVLINN